MQPYFFPYLGYYQLLAAVDTFVFYDDVHYINRGWINRNRMLLNGAPHTFTVPLLKSSQNRLIKDIEVAAASTWSPALLKKMDHAYRKAPYHREVMALLEETLSAGCKTISELASESICRVINYLGLQVRTAYSSDLDYDRRLKGQERILALCEKFSARTYINPINGMELYRESHFDERQIRLRFIRMKEISYDQFKDHKFVAGLSIIDVLMFNSADEVRKMLTQYDLVRSGVV